MMGTAYGVGVGPGDPELMTLKAARVLRDADVVAFPRTGSGESVAYRIAVAAVPEIQGKELVALPAPMVRDRELVLGQQRKNALTVEGYLDRGQDVAILTLGDPALYSTFGYLREELAKDGYVVRVVSGVPSFCAAAARLGVQLAEGDEPLSIVSSATGIEAFDGPGTYVLMKPGAQLCQMCAALEERGRDVWAIERCGMEGERVWHGAARMPSSVGYLTVVVVR